MSTAYIFDVDGTLTPSRAAIDPQFADQFIEFAETRDVYLVTGSDRPKTLEQVGEAVLSSAKMVFNCCGNEAWCGDKLIYSNEWHGTIELLEALEHELEICSFRLRTGNHIEMRQGQINFSVVGRGANLEQRRAYVEYDTTRFERRSVVKRLSERFHDIEFTIAGETGIDIYPKGRDKSQVLQHINASRTVFFGDMITPGGNDWGIAQHCTEHHAVNSWRETRDILQRIVEDDKTRL